MKHFMNKKTGKVYAYESLSDAEKFNDDFSNISEMNDALLESFKNPPPGGRWTVKGWVIDKVLLAEQKVQLISDAENRRKYLLSEANDSVAPLQDAVDLNIATDEEIAALKKWKQYRVLLNRTDTSTAPDIIWPVKPVV